MAYRRYGNSRGRYGRPAFRSRPRRKLIWTNALFTVSGLEAASGRSTLLDSSQWAVNTTAGNLESAKVLQMLLINVSANITGTTGFPTGLTYALYIDDEDDSAAGDPATVAFYENVQPFHVGQFSIPSFTAGAFTDPGPDLNVFELTRRFRVKRRIRTDQRMAISVQSGAALGATTFSITGLCRVLLDLG